MHAIQIQAPVASFAKKQVTKQARVVAVRGHGAQYTVERVKADNVNGVDAATVEKCINAIR